MNENQRPDITVQMQVRKKSSSVFFRQLTLFLTRLEQKNNFKVAVFTINVVRKYDRSKKQDIKLFIWTK